MIWRTARWSARLSCNPDLTLGRSEPTGRPKPCPFAKSKASVTPDAFISDWHPHGNRHRYCYRPNPQRCSNPGIYAPQAKAFRPIPETESRRKRRPTKRRFASRFLGQVARNATLAKASAMRVFSSSGMLCPIPVISTKSQFASDFAVSLPAANGTKGSSLP